MEQKVYLVVAGWDYEGADVQACVATEKEAVELCEKYRDTRYFSYDSVRYEEWRIGEVNHKPFENAK